MQGIAPVYGQDDQTVLLIDSEKTLLDSTPGGQSGEDQTVLWPADAAPSGVVRENSIKPYHPQMQPGSGHNPLITAAQELLAFGVQLAETERSASVHELRQRAVSGIRTFEARSQALGLNRPVWMAARYILCTFLDEMVMTSPWGGAHEWTKESLLSHFHGETYGGQGFFSMLQRACEEPAQNVDLLELMLVILSLGFEGKYRVDADGQRKLDSLRDMIMAMIYRSRGEQNCVLQVGSVEASTPPARKIPPLRYMALGIATCLCTLQVTLYLLLDSQGSELAEQVAGLSVPVLEQADRSVYPNN